MNQCKKCDSTSLTYVTDYEHLAENAECFIESNGWLCDNCNTFHTENSYEWFVNVKSNKVNYSQIMN